MKLGDDTVWAIVRTAAVDEAGRPVRDAYGNARYVETATAVTECAVQPGQSSEDNAAASRSTSYATVYAPLTWPAGAIDAAETSDGRRWEIDGVPARWIFGDLSHVQVQLREVVG